ncbi:MAG: hypothetical protein OXC10_20125 [Rhodospirillaceae bacterium]|nr:hypothetical protein [Rhodospirillaceae bacterium]
MPFFDFDPIDPELELRGDLGPGRENRLDDRIKLASAIEKKTGGAPHAELGRYGETLARRLTGGAAGEGGRPGGRKDSALSPGFLGAVGAAQIRRGTDPDAVVLKDGPTRDALRNKGQGNEVSGFALLPKIARPVGPRAPNRPQDRRVLQGKLASLGHVPRVTEKPLFPPAVAADRPPVWDTNAIWEGPVPDRHSGEPRVPQASFPDFDADPGIAHGLDALLEGVRRFQLAKGLKTDGLVDPGGPTERALDAQNEKARKARLDRLETVNREIMESEAPEYAPIIDRSAADALAGLVVANEVQDQRREKLAEKPDEARAKIVIQKTVRQLKGPDSSKKPVDINQKNNNADEKHQSDSRFDLSDVSLVLEKFDDSHVELFQQKDYWKNRTTLVGILAEIDGTSDVAGFVRKTIAAERREAKARLGNIPDSNSGRPGIVLASGRGGGRQRPRPQRSIGREITQRGSDLRAEKLLKQIRKYDPGFW